MRTLADVVLDAPVFADLAQEARDLLAGCASNVRFDEGNYLFREGEPADVFYLVRHGRVALEAFVPHRGALVIETIDPGELVGWSWLFPPYRWHFHARAATLVRAIRFDATCVRRKCDDDPRFGYALMTRFVPLVVERLQATRLRLVDVYGDAARV